MFILIRYSTSNIILIINILTTYYIIYSYNYVDNIYVIAWIISGMLIWYVRYADITSVVDMFSKSLRGTILFEVSEVSEVYGIYEVLLQQ